MFHTFFVALRGAFRHRDDFDQLSLRELRDLGLCEHVARREADIDAYRYGRW